MKKQLFKKIATVALSAVLAAGMLAGCNKGGSGEGSKDGNGKTAEKDPSELVYVTDYVPIEVPGMGDNHSMMRSFRITRS